MGLRGQFSLALVTGASSGIGEELCRLLADCGVNLIISGRNQDKLSLLAQELSSRVNVTSVVCDLANYNDRIRLVEQIRQSSPDLVINNAGFGLYGDALLHSTSEQMSILEVNGNAMLEITLEAARALIAKEKKGVIVNVASAASFFVFPGLAVYAAAKTFNKQVSQALDIEMQSQGVRVLCACPGMVTTEFSKRAGGQAKDADLKVSMTSREAAEHIIWQIEKRKPVYVFDWRTRWATYFSYLVPASITTMILRKRISQRI